MNEDELNNVFKAFDEGKMSAQESADFQADITAGVIQRPKGKIAQELPSGVVDAYLDGTMDKQAQLDLEDDIKSGFISLPKGILSKEYARPQDVPGNLTGLRLERDKSFDDLAIGVGETGLALATGATSGTVGNIIGTIQGLFEQIQTGKFGTQEGAELIKQKANELTQALTYEPRTEAGQEILQETGEALAPLEALAPIGGQIETLMRGIRPKPQQPISPKTILARDIEAQGIKPFTTDVIQPTTFFGKFAQATGEKIPVTGMGAPRAAQQAQRVEAVRETLRDFGAIEAADMSKNITQSLLKKRGDAIDKYTTMKKTIFGKLQTEGVVPVTKTIRTLDNEINNLESLATKGVNPAIDILRDFKDAIQGNKLVKGADGQDVALVQGGQNIKNIEILRKQLGEELKNPDLASVRTTADKSFNKVYSSLKDDMGSFIKEKGDRKDFLKWEVTNKRLSNLMGELKNNVLASTLAKGNEVPELVNRMLFSQKPSEIKTLYKNLTPQGKNNARSAILYQAYQKSGGAEGMTPEKFLSNINRLGKSTGIFFKGAEAKKLDGLAKALKATSRAGQAALAPATGVQATPLVGAAVLTDLFGGAGAGIASAVSIGGLARLYESAAVRNLLIKISNAPKAKELPLINTLLLEIENQLQKEDK